MDDRAMDSSCAWAPSRKPPPGRVAEAKLSTAILPKLVELDKVSYRRRAPSSVEISNIEISVLVGGNMGTSKAHLDNERSSGG